MSGGGAAKPRFQCSTISDLIMLAKSNYRRTLRSEAVKFDSEEVLRAYGM